MTVVLASSKKEEKPHRWRATFSNGRTATTNKMYKSIPPTHAWHVVLLRPNGTIYAETGFTINEKQAEHTSRQLKRINSLISVKFAEVVPVQEIT